MCNSDWAGVLGTLLGGVMVLTGLYFWVRWYTNR